MSWVTKFTLYFTLLIYSSSPQFTVMNTSQPFFPKLYAFLFSHSQHMQTRMEAALLEVSLSHTLLQSHYSRVGFQQPSLWGRGKCEANNLNFPVLHICPNWDYFMFACFCIKWNVFHLFGNILLFWILNRFFLYWLISHLDHRIHGSMKCPFEGENVLPRI